MIFPLVKFIQRFKSSGTLRYVINLKYSVISSKTWIARNTKYSYKLRVLKFIIIGTPISRLIQNVDTVLSNWEIIYHTEYLLDSVPSF